MGLGRTAPHRLRSAYARALAEIPLPVRSISAPVDEALTVLGQAEVGGRPIRFGTLTEAPRLWVAFADTSPPIFGFLSGLVAERPILQVTETAHLPWTREADHSEQLKRHGIEVWRAAQRWCEG